MDDTISRQEAIDALTKHLRTTDVPASYPGIITALTEWMNDLPSAQPEIIRCKDCKWKQGSECVRFAEVRPFPDDFCSRAERITDERSISK